ncbi:hypothetical protein QE408_004204 [Agrobacterium larrymoorei]|uniref:Uncharacterized protein n=1 Tax=Agrobacterium larrymoorei TaxID=160699 RepID=A0ABU0UQ04_9HYPH|nr:hypothetical protein [Agrobacterium larrymoorei]
MPRLSLPGTCIKQDQRKTPAIRQIAAMSYLVMLERRITGSKQRDWVDRSSDIDGN